MTGPIPKELTCLKATISFARVQHHVVSIHAGAHKQIKGWHSMYLNDVSGVMGTANWCIANTENGNDDNDSIDSQTARAISNEREEAEYVRDTDDSDNDDDDKEHVNQAPQCDKEQGHPKLGKVCVVLAGPFTETQATTARQRKVSFERIKNALMWLKANNCLYAKENIQEKDFREPIVLEDIKIVDSISHNVE
jgi:hypothetical protein